MNDYGMSVMQLMGPMMFGVSLLLWLVVIGPLLIYPLARWKQNREGTVDTQLGFKVAIHYFRLIGFQTLLLGGAILLYTIASKASEKGDMYRMAFGFLVPGGIIFGIHHVALARTNDAVSSTVRRLFMGYNLLVTGLVGSAALVAGFQALFAKHSAGDSGRLFLAAILVYCGAWAASAIQLSKLVLGPSMGSMMPPSNMMPPSGPAHGMTPPSGTGLPPLSAGSYPPIEPKT